jgi:PAS domain-containing protein
MSIARDVSGQDLVAAQAALQRATERMENMLESLTDGFCAVDRDWNITYINGRALQMVEPLNKRRGDLVGARLWARQSPSIAYAQWSSALPSIANSITAA